MSSSVDDIMSVRRQKNQPIFLEDKNGIQRKFYEG